ncbi:hypersensitive response-inducing protein [Seiridium cupressi]
MKFAGLLSVAAVASAATIKRDNTVFAVSDFSAGCIAHSTQCLYSFSVLQTGTMETKGVNCSASESANTDGTLPDVPRWTGTCELSSRTFSIIRNADGLEFTVEQPVSPASNQTASYLIPNSDLVMATEPNAEVQSYNGPTSLNLSA